MDASPDPAADTRRAGSRRAPRRPSRLARSVRSPWTVAGCAVVTGVCAGLLTGGVLTNEVRLAVDGGEKTVRSFGGTVRDVLGSAKIRLGPYDHVDPAPTEQVRDGTSIVVRHARSLVLTLDGRRSTHTVTALNVGEALQELDLNGRPARLSASKMRQIPVSGFTLDVQTQRRVTVVRGRVRYETLTTGRTVGAVLAQEKIRLSRGDRVRPSLDSPLQDGGVIRIIPASPASAARTMAVSRSVASLNWRALARCETYANPRSLNPDGPYYGMYQLSLPRWRAVGGTKTPLDWPAPEQTYRAQLLYQKLGGRWQAQWPNCGSRLFIR